MIAGALFEGIGGFGRALEANGHVVSWAIDNNAFCADVLRKRFSTDVLHCDVQTVEYEHGEVEIMTGGFPCQDVSGAGAVFKLGINGDRSSLYRQLMRAVNAIQPRYVVIENVRQLLNNGFDALIEDAGTLGYSCEWDVLSAQMFGAPHLRERVFVVLHREDEPIIFSQEIERKMHVSAPYVNGWRRWETSGFTTHDGIVWKTSSIAPRRKKARLPTIVSRDWHDGKPSTDFERAANHRNIAGALQGTPTAEFAEWLMGYPIGWTDLAVDNPERRSWHDEPIERVTFEWDTEWRNRIRALGNSLVPCVAEEVIARLPA